MIIVSFSFTIVHCILINDVPVLDNIVFVMTL